MQNSHEGRIYDDGSEIQIMKRSTSMKKITAIFTVLLLLMRTLPAIAASAINKDGYYKGIKLSGRGKVVEHFADIKVKVVDSFQDLRVKVIESSPDAIGKWEFVESGEDFTVQFVDSLPDIKMY